MAIDKVVSASITDSSVTSAKVASGVLQPNFRNIIINGDMSQAQRATSTSSITGGAYHTLDRFKTFINNTAGTWTQSQDTTVPTGQGFAKSLKMDCTTAKGSLDAGDILRIQQAFEGQNLQYLKKGTSSAESLTASFWVRSNKTGTYVVELEDRDNTRYVSQSYTISSADTWEKKTVTFPGDTSGAFSNDNGESLRFNFWLAAGTNYNSGTLGTTWHTTNANRAVGIVNLADSTSNEWYLTGVQLEVGTAASDFEFLPVDVNLQRCQRYFEKMLPESMIMLRYSGSTSFGRAGNFKVTKRASPSLSRENGTTTIGAYNGEGGAGSATNSAWAANSVDAEGISISATTPTSPDQFFMGMGGDHFFADSEL